MFNFWLLFIPLCETPSHILNNKVICLPLKKKEHSTTTKTLQTKYIVKFKLPDDKFLMLSKLSNIIVLPYFKSHHQDKVTKHFNIGLIK